MEIHELEVPVPWGHISVKAWGDPKNEAIICLHGLHDNACTFDALIPLLPRNYYYLCLDLPGHGFSSWFPSGLPIQYTTFLFAILAVKEYFKRQQYILLGHSIGGRLAILFTQIFPEFVSKLATLDSAYTIPVAPSEYFWSFRKAYDDISKSFYFKADEKPSYSYEKIIDKVANGRVIGTLTRDAAKQLADRMIKKVGDDEYEFTIDKRLKTIIYPSFSSQYIDDIFEKHPIMCPAMSIYASNTVEAVRSFGDVYKYTLLPNFKRYDIEGHHHSHHTNPELFAPILTTFLLEQKNKL